MEFMNRSGRPAQPAAAPANNSPAVPSPVGSGSRKKGVKGMLGLKLASVALLFSATVLVVALLWFVVLGSPNKEGRYVDSNRMQAVFLNGGQVYFGRIKDLNDSYMRVREIYYLRVNQQVQPDQQQQAAANDISLVKLGCELHGPQDEMLINRDQVVFWENLKSDSQVAKAVDEYKKQNPNGQQDCEQPQQQSNTGEQNQAETNATPAANTNNTTNTNRNTTTTPSNNNR